MRILSWASRQVLTAVLGGGLIAVDSGVSQARVYGGLGRNQGNQNNSSSNRPSNNTTPQPVSPPPAPPASQPTVSPQVKADEAAEKSAMAALLAAQQTLKGLEDAAFAKYSQSPEWTDAQSKLQSAQADVDSAKSAAKQALASNPDYQAAVAAKQKASDDLTAAKASGDATPETLSPLASASLQATMTIRKLENGVFTNDAGVQAATQALASAQHDCDALKAKFIQGLASDPTYASAKAEVDSAQKRYEDAHSRLLADTPR
jgi:hypothetical protein